MKPRRADIASMRREQVIQAAMAVITEQGLHNLSLAEIENRTGMSRGQLTYYFPFKEDILLAVFDRLLVMMYRQIGTPEGQVPEPPAEPNGADACRSAGWEWVEHLLQAILSQPLVGPEFHCLQYTFLSQIGYREDIRRRLASLYEEWRGNMARGLEEDLARKPAVRGMSPRALATFVQAILHGLAVQMAADPDAVNRPEMLKLCRDMLSTYLWQKPAARSQPRGPARKRSASNGSPTNRGARAGSSVKGKTHERPS